MKPGTQAASDIAALLQAAVRSIRCGGLSLLLFGLLLPGKVSAFDIHDMLERTRIVDIRVGAGLSEDVGRYRSGGYLLSDATPVSFADWYGTDWKNVEAVFVTELGDTFGVYWGVGTGERGEKYEIDPSVRIGFIKLFNLSRRATFSVSASVVAGGRLSEKPCVADYGMIGGRQRVNCRLAATVLPPAETLEYLFDAPPPDRLRIALRYTIRF